jgi:hypothetical protein
MLPSKPTEAQNNANALTMFDFSSIDMMDPSLSNE